MKKEQAKKEILRELKVNPPKAPVQKENPQKVRRAGKVNPVSQVTENQVTENQVTENQVTENRVVENRVVENRVVENQVKVRTLLKSRKKQIRLSKKLKPLSGGWKKLVKR